MKSSFATILSIPAKPFRARKENLTISIFSENEMVAEEDLNTDVSNIFAISFRFGFYLKHSINWNRQKMPTCKIDSKTGTDSSFYLA